MATFFQKWTPLIDSNSKKRDKSMMQLIIKYHKKVQVGKDQERRNQKEIPTPKTEENIPHIQVTSNYY